MCCMFQLKKAQTLLVSSYVNRRHSKRKTHQPVKIITDVGIYNTLMHAWAAQVSHDGHLTNNEEQKHGML